MKTFAAKLIGRSALIFLVGLRTGLIRREIPNNKQNPIIMYGQFQPVMLVNNNFMSWYVFHLSTGTATVWSVFTDTHLHID